MSMSSFPFSSYPPYCTQNALLSPSLKIINNEIFDILSQPKVAILALSVQASLNPWKGALQSHKGRSRFWGPEAYAIWGQGGSLR